MKYIILFLVFFSVSSLWAGTPDIDTVTYQYVNLECPNGRSCIKVDDSFCSEDKIEIFPNDDDTFDVLFNGFDVETDDRHDYGSAVCRLKIPVKVPPGQRVSLEEVGVSGLTIIPESGKAKASITYSTPSGRESSRVETFAQSEAFALIHRQEIGDGFSNCGSGDAIVGTLISLSASRPVWQTEETLISVSGGSGKLVYKLNYEECEPQPEQCREDQLEFDGVCYDEGLQCSDYHNTNSQVCNNSNDSLKCDWDIKRNLCYSKCNSNQFYDDGICYDKAQMCSEYNNTDAQVCNNGEDKLRCDWLVSENICVSECPPNSFEKDGVCYARNGVCSQYNGTDKKTCNSDLDNLSCDWIPYNFGNSRIENTCVSSCPEGAFDIDGRCYKKKGVCSQYNGTSSRVCNTGQDNMRCDWNASKKTCFPE